MKISKLIAGAAAAAALALSGNAALAADSAWQGEAPLKDGGWQVVELDKDAVMLFDGNGIERRGAETRMWVAMLFSSDQISDKTGKHYIVLLARYSIDCQARTWRPVALRTLDGDYKVVDTVENNNTTPQPASSSEIQGKLVDNACNPGQIDKSKGMDDLMLAHGAYLQVLEDAKKKQ